MSGVVNAILTCAFVAESNLGEKDIDRLITSKFPTTEAFFADSSFF